MTKFFSVLFVTFLVFNNVATASTINLDVEESGGIFFFVDTGDAFPIGELSGTDGAGSLVSSSFDDGSRPATFTFTMTTQNALLTYVNSDRVLKIAELVVVSGTYSNGHYAVSSFQYSWDSCETIQGSEGCNNFITITPLTATLTHTGGVFSLATSARALLVGYSFSEPFAIERQFELTPVPLPAAAWFLVSALVSLRWLGAGRRL